MTTASWNNYKRSIDRILNWDFCPPFRCGDFALAVAEARMLKRGCSSELDSKTLHFRA